MVRKDEDEDEDRVIVNCFADPSRIVNYAEAVNTSRYYPTWSFCAAVCISERSTLHVSILKPGLGYQMPPERPGFALRESRSCCKKTQMRSAYAIASLKNASAPVLMSLTSSFLTEKLPNSSSSSSSTGWVAFLPFLEGVPSAPISVAERLPDFGVRGVRAAAGVLGVVGVLTMSDKLAPLFFSLRLILPNVTEALAGVY